MDWTQFATLIVVNLAFTLTLWLWNRSETRLDLQHMDNRLEAIRELVHAIHLESRDFHGRLCAIEERNRK